MIRSLFFITSMLVARLEQLEFKLIHLFLKPEYVRRGACHKSGMCCRDLVIGVPHWMARRDGIMRYLFWWHKYRFNFNYTGHKDNLILYSCGYLSADNHCSIYRWRPRLCREFPKELLWGHLKLYKGCGFQWVKNGSSSFDAILAKTDQS